MNVTRAIIGLCLMTACGHPQTTTWIRGCKDKQAVATYQGYDKDHKAAERFFKEFCKPHGGLLPGEESYHP